VTDTLPTLSIVTAVFNGVETIAEAVASVRAQQGVSLEHVMLDGGSSDGTREWLTAHADYRTRLILEPDAGIYDALNKGFDRATGEVVGLLHADDLFAHERVLAKVAATFSDPEVDAVYGDLQYVRREDPAKVVRQWTSGPFTSGRLKFGWMPPHPTLFLRRSTLERLGPFNLSYRIAADYEFMLRLLKDPGYRIAYLPEVLVKMRVGGVSNRSFRNMMQKSSEDLRAMRIHGVGGLFTLAAKNLRKIPQFL
jgi:glycosyltransferase involved in cell wall biosynthesis